MRTIHGEILLPSDAPHREARSILVELRDVSVADAPSTVVASTRLTGVACKPGGRVPFTLEAPESAKGRMLALRVHVDWDGDGSVSRGDLLTTESIRVPGAGDVGMARAPVRLI